MRYYQITLTDAGGSQAAQWSSYANGRFDPNALDIAFDAVVATQGQPMSRSLPMLTIYGIPLKLLQQAQVFTGMSITVTAGMGGGLPLEDPSQKGIILAGQVFQSFGNWVGTDMTLDFVVAPSISTLATPGQFSFTWRNGQQLSDALDTTLTAAFPASSGLTAKINLADTWTRPVDVNGYYGTLNELASALITATASMPNGPVEIAVSGSSINVYDGAYKGTTTTLRFEDLIGQPTWIGVNEMQVKTVLRGDLNLGARIKMPAGYTAGPGSIQTTQAAFPSQIRYKPTFSGTFIVNSLRHVGQFRASDSGEWATIINVLQPQDAS